MPAPPAPRTLTGVVVSAGKMMKTVKVRVPDREWNKRIRKYFPAPYNILVHDPAQSTREGDIVNVTPGWRSSQHVRHVVSKIVAPFGSAVEDRPAVPTEEERIKKRAMQRLRKDVEQAGRGREAAVQRINSEWRPLKDIVKRLSRKEPVRYGLLRRLVEERYGSGPVAAPVRRKAVKEGEEGEEVVVGAVVETGAVETGSAAEAEVTKVAS